MTLIISAERAFIWYVRWKMEIYIGTDLRLCEGGYSFEAVNVRDTYFGP